ncbi:uncharacterized protein LOC131314832 isoform X3 [Rhododendron vialii]|uniref:uncharacterized protein LOC131314832 isoform X3 n=1 Tax=Rhododendron vialii TaxID=182163 RepID=UPI00265EC696|nr:uncharacterized protein LOC131314832 isoform X3 [Rhododendron vialii]
MELDPSLIEIVGEDDSLVQQIPTPDHYYFPCSPLQIPRSSGNPDRARLSPFTGLKGNVNVEKSTCSSPEGSTRSNKENINGNKSEVPKLSVEPQPMKRKKRGGAYNLRKSLAWDRAFFTEEGVLNPLELSILSGRFGNSSSEVMPTIQEEGRKVSSNTGSTNDSTDMQGTPKMLSNKKSSRTGSKGGDCPRPLVYSSLKRPANASTIKVAMKESKLPKLRVSRPGAHSLPKSSKSSVLSTSHSKHNQIGQADIFQKSSGLQDSSKKAMNSANKANSGSVSSIMAGKSPCQPPRRNMANVALGLRPSTDPQPTLAMKAKRGLDVFPTAVLPPSGSRAPDSHDVSRKSGIPTTKPSGLRMPSPSLGFFGQPKSSASNSSSGKATLPSNILESCTPSLQRINTSNYAHDPRLLRARGKMPKIDNKSTVSGNARVSDPSKESVPSAGNDDASGEKGKLKLEGEVMKYQLMKENKEVHNFIDEDKGFQEYREAHKDNSFCEESGFQMNDNNRLLQSGYSGPVKDTETNELESTNFASQCSFVELAKGDTIINDTIKNQHIEDEPYSFGVGTHAVIFKTNSDFAAGDIKQDFLIPQNDNSSDVSDDDEYSGKKVEPMKVSSDKADQSLDGEKRNLMSNEGILLETRSTFDSQRYQSENVENVDSTIPETIGSEKLSSKSPPRESAANESAAAVDPSNRKLHVENHKWYSDTQFEPDLSLMKSRDHLAGDVTNIDSIVCCSLSIEEDKGANELKKNISAEKAETKFSSENLHKDNKRTKINGGILVRGNRALDEFHSGDLGNSTDVSLINGNSSGSEMEICQSASLLEYTEQANEDAAGNDKTTDGLCSEDTEAHSLDGNLLAGSSNSCHSNSEIDCQSVMATADVNEQSSGLPDLQMPSLVVHNGFQYNHGLHSNYNLSHGKGTSSDAPQEEQVLANVPFVPEQNADDSSESKSFSAAIQVPLSMQGSGVDMVGTAEDQLLEHAPSSSVDNEASIENIERSVDSGLGNDMEFTGEATSLESDLAVMMRDDGQAIGTSATYKAFCLREESGFADQQIQNLANETEILDPGVENINAFLPDDTGVEISQTNISPTPTVKLQHKMDNAICIAEDMDRTVQIKKSRDGGKQNNLMINPPVNAVPFSDEWLAAMEAAGEDILKMKSGAVQNSPPDRSLPEPGPWSPVKRKHTEIGPYDCTKFNILPPDSD